MYKLCLLLACLACGSNGRRLQAKLDKYFNREDGQKLVKQLNSSAGSRSNGQAKLSGSGQLVKNMADPRKIVPMLLTLFSPAVVVAPPSKGLAFKSSAFRSSDYGETKRPIWSNYMAANARPRVVMTDESYAEEAPPGVWGATVSIVVSVDWGGIDLYNRNLEFFKVFHEAHPDVPLTHFMNAAYFTKSKDEVVYDQWSPYKALRPIDECGLYILGLKSLVESAGVKFRSEQTILQSPEDYAKTLKEEEELMQLMDVQAEFEKTFEGEDKLKEQMKIYSPEWWQLSESDWKKASERLQLRDYLSRDPGHDTDIRAYSVDELRAIISKSKAILEKQGLKVGKSFRVGGRLAGPNVLEAFRSEGFRINSSAVGLDDMISKLASEELEFWRNAPLSDMLRDLWPGITKESQPYLLENPAGWVIEMPDTVGAAEHTTVEDMVDHIDSAVQQLDLEDRFAHLGFSQESAAEYGPRVIEAITEIKRKHGHRVVFETLAASARRARSTLRLKEMEAKIKPQHMSQKS